MTSSRNVHLVLSEPEAVSDIATKQYVDKTLSSVSRWIPQLKSFLSLLHISPNRIDFGNKRISGLQDPLDNDDASTKRYVDSSVTNIRRLIDNIVSWNKLNVILKAFDIQVDTIRLNSKRISNLSAPSESSDASTKKYVDDNCIQLKKQLEEKIDLNHKNVLGSDNGSNVIQLKSKRLTGVADPLTMTDAATKKYVDGIWSQVESKITPLIHAFERLNNFFNHVAVKDGGFDVRNLRIENVSDPIHMHDAVNKKYTEVVMKKYIEDAIKKYIEDLIKKIDRKLSPLINDENNIRGKMSQTALGMLNFFSVTERVFDIQNKRLIHIKEPIVDTDAVNKAYVDKKFSNQKFILRIDSIPSTNPSETRYLLHNGKYEYDLPYTGNMTLRSVTPDLEVITFEHNGIKSHLQLDTPISVKEGDTFSFDKPYPIQLGNYGLHIEFEYEIV